MSEGRGATLKYFVAGRGSAPNIIADQSAQRRMAPPHMAKFAKRLWKSTTIRVEL